MQMAAWTAAAAGHTHKKTLQFIYSVACTAKKKSQTKSKQKPMEQKCSILFGSHNMHRPHWEKNGWVVGGVGCNQHAQTTLAILRSFKFIYCFSVNWFLFLLFWHCKKYVFILLHKKQSRTHTGRGQGKGGTHTYAQGRERAREIALG